MTENILDSINIPGLKDISDEIAEACVGGSFNYSLSDTAFGAHNPNDPNQFNGSGQPRIRTGDLSDRNIFQVRATEDNSVFRLRIFHEPDSQGATETVYLPFTLNDGEFSGDLLDGEGPGGFISFNGENVTANRAVVVRVS